MKVGQIYFEMEKYPQCTPVMELNKIKRVCGEDRSVKQ